MYPKNVLSPESQSLLRAFIGSKDKDGNKMQIGIFFSVKVFRSVRPPPTDSVSSVTLFVGSRQCVHPSTTIIHILRNNNTQTQRRTEKHNTNTTQLVCASIDKHMSFTDNISKEREDHFYCIHNLTSINHCCICCTSRWWPIRSLILI